jgi:hypothetical protein
MDSNCGFSPRVSISADPAENAVKQGTLEMLGCVNLQSEQSRNSHHELFWFFTEIGTIVSKSTETSK